MDWLPVWKQSGWKQVGKSLRRVKFSWPPAAALAGALAAAVPAAVGPVVGAVVAPGVDEQAVNTRAAMAARVRARTRICRSSSVRFGRPKPVQGTPKAVGRA